VPIVVENQKQSQKKAKRVVLKKQKLLPGAELVDKNRITQSFFTSIHDLSDIILNQLSGAKKSLYIAAFNLTDNRIADLLIEKQKLGVDVCVITDASNMKHTYSKIHKLIDNKVPVWRYSPALNPNYIHRNLSEPLMHHKCMCIDNEVVITGSANLTKSGQRDNVENINILRDVQAVNEHCQEIKRLKKYCIECKSLNTD
jgi:phosphatidylserine/phosphatidylglycerophosphate/cardiolipin synthase-like enzyme